MLVIETATPPISFLASTVAYRGINEEQYRRLKASGLIAPFHPLNSSAEMITLFKPLLPMAHVLEKKRDHFVSFSLQPGTAVWYGTTGGKEDGYLVEVPLPVSVVAMCEGGEQAVAYAGKDDAGKDDGTHWIDPRHIVVGAHLIEWSRFRSRAIEDQEVLLAAGSLKPVKILHVAKGQCDQRFAPWALTGEKMRIL